MSDNIVSLGLDLGTDGLAAGHAGHVSALIASL